MISAETYNADYEKAVKFGYNKGIEEFAESLSLRISESLIWGFLPVNCRDGVSDEIADYVLDTVREVAKQLKGEQ